MLLTFLEHFKTRYFRHLKNLEKLQTLNSIIILQINKRKWQIEFPTETKLSLKVIYNNLKELMSEIERILLEMLFNQFILCNKHNLYENLLQFK